MKPLEAAHRRRRLTLLLDKRGDSPKIPGSLIHSPVYVAQGAEVRDCILGPHLTDDLKQFGIPHDHTSDERLQRAISWKYQVEIVRATPKPRRWLTLRFEEGMKLEEIAEVTRAPLPTVKSRVQRGLQALRGSLRREDLL